jgi:nitrite reductase/ring-hydroxylating ferredoxin subunit
VTGHDERYVTPTSRRIALIGIIGDLRPFGLTLLRRGLKDHPTVKPTAMLEDALLDLGRVFALDNRCPHMGFPLDRGSGDDGILTCHWHHARFDLESGCAFDLWADDVPICPVEVRNGEIWVKTTFGHADPAGHWRRRHS